MNTGRPLGFEAPYWSGERSLGDDYPLPFHPLELGEDVLFNFRGYRLEGIVSPHTIEPFDSPLLCFQRS